MKSSVQSDPPRRRMHYSVLAVVLPATILFVHQIRADIVGYIFEDTAGCSCGHDKTTSVYLCSETETSDVLQFPVGSGGVCKPDYDGFVGNDGSICTCAMSLTPSVDASIQAQSLYQPDFTIYQLGTNLYSCGALLVSPYSLAAGSSGLVVGSSSVSTGQSASATGSNTNSGNAVSGPNPANIDPVTEHHTDSGQGGTVHAPPLTGGIGKRKAPVLVQDEDPTSQIVERGMGESIKARGPERQKRQVASSAIPSTCLLIDTNVPPQSTTFSTSSTKTSAVITSSSTKVSSTVQAMVSTASKSIGFASSIAAVPSTVLYQTTTTPQSTHMTVTTPSTTTSSSSVLTSTSSTSQAVSPTIAPLLVTTAVLASTSSPTAPSTPTVISTPVQESSQATTTGQGLTTALSNAQSNTVLPSSNGVAKQVQSSIVTFLLALCGVLIYTI